MLGPKQIASQAEQALSILDVVRTAKKYEKQLIELKAMAEEIETNRIQNRSDRKLADESILAAEHAWEKAHSERAVSVAEQRDWKQEVKQYKEYEDSLTVSLNIRHEKFDTDLNLLEKREADADKVDKELKRVTTSLMKKENAIEKREKAVALTEQKLQELFPGKE